MFSFIGHKTINSGFLSFVFVNCLFAVMVLCYLFWSPTSLISWPFSLFVVVTSSDYWILKLQIVPFDPTKKKKKKKNITIVDPADDPVDKLAEKTENLSGMQNKTSNFPLWFWFQCYLEIVLMHDSHLFLTCSCWWGWDCIYWFEKEEEEACKSYLWLNKYWELSLFNEQLFLLRVVGSNLTPDVCWIVGWNE